MNPRIPVVVTLLLVLVAFGGFYFALSPRSSDVVTPMPTVSASSPVAASSAPPAAPVTAAPTPAAPAPAPAAPQPMPDPPAAAIPVAPPAPAAPAKATPESIEAEIASSENAELQRLLKSNFSDEYKEMIDDVVRRRNEGTTAEQSSQGLLDRLQDLMRNKLKYAVGASMPTIDKLAENETRLFHALGTESAALCLKLLGKDDTPSDHQPPANVRDMMRLGTFYRFQAIVEGMPDVKPVAPLTADDMKAFEASLSSDGLKFDEIRSGAFLTKEGNEPGKACLMLEKLYQAVARLPEDTRRKIYAGIFFLGRDK